MQKTISKSKYMNGLQCPKLLWFVFNEPGEIPEADEATKFILDQGKELTNLAKKLFPKGIEVPYDSNLIEATKKFVGQRKTIFEAAFSYKGTFAMLDILIPVNKDEWDIIEVKSSTQVKDENIDDVAFQRYVLQGNGLKVRRCHQMCINKEYVRQGRIDPEKLLIQEDITDLVAEKLHVVEDNVREMQKVIAQSKPPEMSIGPHCSNPYACQLVDKCSAFLPEHNVTELYYCRQKFELIDKGILRIKDLPTGFKLSEKQAIQKEAINKGKPVISKEQIKEFLKSLEYPLYCLDFETLNVAIPPFDRARPYQKIAFQFSIYVIRNHRGQVESYEFLADGTDNFAPEVVEALKVVGPNGTVLAYHMSFEKQVLEALDELSPKDGKWLRGIIGRLKDLEVPFKSFSYYHPEQHGSCSLKAVLPLLSGKSYGGMEIQEGGMASMAYYTTHFRDCPTQEKEKVRKALLEYCKLDTEGMVDILRKLEEVSSG